jgi:hypothetical protein
MFCASLSRRIHNAENEMPAVFLLFSLSKTIKALDASLNTPFLFGPPTILKNYSQRTNVVSLRVGF